MFRQTVYTCRLPLKRTLVRLTVYDKQQVIKPPPKKRRSSALHDKDKKFAFLGRVDVDLMSEGVPYNGIRVPLEPLVDPLGDVMETAR